MKKPHNAFAVWGQLCRLRGSLAQCMTLCIHVQSVNGGGAGHEQTVALGAAESQVGNHFWGVQESQQSAIGVMDTNAVGFHTAPTPAAPHIAIGVTTDTVCETRGEVGEDFGVAEFLVFHIKHDDVGRVAWTVGRASVDHIAFLEVR